MVALKHIVLAFLASAASVSAVRPEDDFYHLYILVTRYNSTHCQEGTGLNREAKDLVAAGNCHTWNDDRTFQSLRWWIPPEEWLKSVTLRSYCGIKLYSDFNCDDRSGVVPSINDWDRMGTCANAESPEGYRPFLTNTKSLKVKCEGHPWYETYKYIMYESNDPILVPDDGKGKHTKTYPTLVEGPITTATFTG